MGEKDRLSKSLSFAVRGATVVLLFLILPWPVRGAHVKAREQVQGQVVQVQKRRVQSPEFTIGGSNPSDAPLISRYYEFEIAVRVGCMTYIGSYDTPFNYVPFSADQHIQFRLTKHVMYFDVPNTAGMRVHIARRQNECGKSR